MTNNWVDLAYSTCFIVQGANPVENHPASIAHLNAARFDTNGRGRNAALVVIDPRQTRTARMIKAGYDATNLNDMRKHDRYVRIRPGTNVAFNNGVLNAIITWMYANPTDSKSVNFFAWHNSTAPNSTATRNIVTDAGTHLNTLGVGVANWPKYCDSRIKLTADGQDYQRTTVTATNSESVSNFPLLAANIDDAECVFQRLRAHVAKYTPAVVADICGCTEADIAAVRDAYIDNSRFASSDFGAAKMTQNAAGYRAACIMYAMGATQFTTGSQGVRGYAQIQTMMGNMGRCGGGINALRGIHNVQGSTDMGVLFDLIPGYSGNPGVGVSYPSYSNALFGNRVLETNVTRPTTRSAYTPADLGLQQRGFYNMTREWFGDRTVTTQADFDKLWDLWPKGNGVQHIEAFRRMCPESGADYTYTPVAGAPRISACVVWGQNPAITEPNQGAVRTGLYNLDLLVVADMFATETAQCSRKGTGVTYLLPSCSHVEEAGSVSSSGRWIQWRDRAAAPKGNSKADLELLLKLAKALDGAGAFSHITTQWATLSTPIVGSAYNVLYGKYGWDGTGSMEAVSGLDAEGATLTGSEYVAEQIYKEMCSPLNAASGPAGTLWIYSGNGAASGYNPYVGDSDPVLFHTAKNVVVTDEDGVVTYAVTTDYVVDLDFGLINRVATGAISDGQTVLVTYEWGSDSVGWTAVTDEAVVLTGTNKIELAFKANTPVWAKWGKANRAKSRQGRLTAGTAATSGQYPRYGWAWLLNRRIFYNNGELTGDVNDVFVAPAFIARLYTINTNTLADWSTLYRAYNTLADMPNAGTGAGNINGDPHVYPGRLPAFTEPYESPRPDLVTTWGKNTANGASLIMADTPIGAVANYPLVLTTIRCVEHFQGGPITRNNAHNVDCEPDPWIEINSADAIKYGITDGMWVNVVTARGESVTTQEALTAAGALAPVSGWAKGFKARVGVGTLANQRVAPGTVAIPWHWGDRGLGVGSRANDLCIDSWDANTMIPEYKACLCRIEPATP